MFGKLGRKASLVTLFLGLSACGNGGQINFDPGYIAKTSKVPGFNMVTASQALAVESGKTVSTGYHAKLQLNEVKGTKLAGGPYTAKIKYTVRNR